MSFWKRTSSGADPDGFQPGLTPRSLFACVLCMLLAAMYTQYSMVILGECYIIPESSMPVPAMIALLIRAPPEAYSLPVRPRPLTTVPLEA